MQVPQIYRKTWHYKASKIQQKFETDLYNQWLGCLRRTGCGYDTITCLAFKILLENDEYDELRGKMRFSKDWFRKWKKTFHVGWATIHGSKKYFPKEVIDGYRSDYREKLKDYPLKHRYNFDESAFLHSWLGNKSYIPLNGVDEAFVEKGSEKLRMTAGSFINADGSDSSHMLIVKNYARDLKGTYLFLRTLFRSEV